jgi:hypothetical protein
MSAFLGIAEIGFLLSILFEPIKITSIVRGMCASMLLAQVAMLCCKPPSYIPYKGTYVPYDGTFDAPDQG